MSLINKVYKILMKESTIYKNQDVINWKDDYVNYINRMKVNGYYVEHLFLREISKSTLNVYNLNKNEYGTFLSILCPAGKIMTICGSLQCGDLKFFITNLNLYDIPHYFSIKCTNENDEELSEDCVIDIMKVKPSGDGEIESLDSVLYADISLYKYKKFKEKQDRYCFKRGIILYGNQCLVFKTTPNINVTKVKLFASADILTRKY